jgi:hypothetical protein
MPRSQDLIRFYSLLERLEQVCGGYRMLCNCHGRQNWPRRGVYFFSEKGEERTDSGTGRRIVRVGTHALRIGAQSTLWQRLKQHKGTNERGGNHRGSIFRLLVGDALIHKHGYIYDNWGHGAHAPREILQGEESLEQEVSAYIGQMPFLWLEVDDDPGPDSMRGYVERNAIALLSNYERENIDPPSHNWLGNYSTRPNVINSGLWNQNHVEEDYDLVFLDRFEELICNAGEAP